MSVPNPYEFPDDLPCPQDDGGFDGFLNQELPDVPLRSMDGQWTGLHAYLGQKTVLWLYPGTGVPGKDPIPDWEAIPGAPGCTVQALSFRDQHDRLKAAGFTLLGISSQAPSDQSEFYQRVKLGIPLLSDESLKLMQTCSFPTFTASGKTFYKRAILCLEGRRIQKIFYPVFPPYKSASLVLDWLQQS